MAEFKPVSVKANKGLHTALCKTILYECDEDALHMTHVEEHSYVLTQRPRRYRVNYPEDDSYMIFIID